MPLSRGGRAIAPALRDPGLTGRARGIGRSAGLRHSQCQGQGLGGSRCVEAYWRTCARLGQQPFLDVCTDLVCHGALVVDLRLCRDAEALLVFLREAPLGVRQVVLYDGAHFYGGEPRYRHRLAAVHLRAGQPPVLGDSAWLRQFLASLGVFSEQRGSKLAVLQLTGLQFGLQGSTLVSPLARCLWCLTALQRLHFADCWLGDCGLSILLPHLSGGLPKLSHLSLARNRLSDVRLIAALLQGRAAFQKRRGVAPLVILDLSWNPGLAPSHPSSGDVHGNLLEVVCEALRAGLALRTMRLRSMRLRGQALRPLLQHLSTQARQRQVGFPSKMHNLVSISLEGNPVAPDLVLTISQVLKQLARPFLGVPWFPDDWPQPDTFESAWLVDFTREGQQVEAFSRGRFARQPPSPTLARTLSSKSLPAPESRIYDYDGEWGTVPERCALSE
eukprot:CAMPEP_0183458026 /NCGR_PEP_ID=MMETSP0370-20130417/132649_1 /TAXON_ID=268820 /ORGANISM="Peridinium aciculiferum, Strain PAER-2" /LENGTH=444 /DNA_ID=CAMNT_0025649775 /DNA_START=1 /DNA_END=1332 /DNA_ORIENTATION=+